MNNDFFDNYQNPYSNIYLNDEFKKLFKKNFSFDNIYEEIDYAKQIFQKYKRWPVFNVTDRALEETASEITRIVCQRMGIKNKNYVF